VDIRKISIGPDYKSGAMHYLVGQEILNGNFFIHLIKKDGDSILVYIQSDDEVLLWKEFTYTMPISIEYNINF
jgi:hypothetical protein|tara:strand:- start:325 stop:543 length:219 start_codon:yes stop_codon:yes gene_type:complete